tara:strand:+ start:25 stop:696 length:672 start_codon:yes stop_codon:yes gene_type:complete
MTLNEIAYNILNIVRGGRSNSDEHISLSQIKFNIKYYRAMMIRRDLARNNFMSRHLEQDLGCIKMKAVNASKCCDFDIHCEVYKSEVKIPRTVRANFKDMITYVGGVDGITRIPVIQPDYVKFIPYDKYTKNQRKAFFIEDYLYIYNPDGIELINVRGVFEDPEEVAKFDCDGTDCYDDDTPFPMPADMVQAITTALLSGEMMMIANTPGDTTLDRTQDMPKG